MIVVPVFKALAAPSRNFKVTVPPVVGVHEIVAGCPAVKEMPPGGILNGLSPLPCCAIAAAKRAKRDRIWNCILKLGKIGGDKDENFGEMKVQKVLLKLVKEG